MELMAIEISLSSLIAFLQLHFFDTRMKKVRLIDLNTNDEIMVQQFAFKRKNGDSAA
jgi:hypothetical protein